VPRWGLVDSIAPPHTESRSTGKVSEQAVQATLLASAAVFALAAAAHVLRYILLLINRDTLLPPLVADGALLMGVVVSLAAIAAMIASMAVTTAWLIGRRGRAFRSRGHGDPRPEWTLWAGCLTPLVNLVWAPVFVIELAHAELAYPRLRGRIAAWWAAWLASALISGWATWTSSTEEPQGVADNTVTEILAYLVGFTALLLLWRVVAGFANRPVQQSSPNHRWVVVGGGSPEGERPITTGAAGSIDHNDVKADAVESLDPEPAA